MATTIQNLHSLTAGNKPGDLLAGEIAYNVADGYVYLGNGSNAFTDTLGQNIGTPVTPGNGWQQAVYNASPINGSVILGGTYDAQANEVTSITTAGGTAGLVVGDPLPASAAGNAELYVLVTIGGTLTPPAPTGTADPGDWIVSTGAGWSLVQNSNVTIPASNVTVVPSGDLTGPDLQTVLSVQIPLNYVNQATGVVSELNCNGDALVYGNTTLGDASTDTLTVAATSSFSAPVSMGIAAPVSMGNNLAVTGAISTNTSIYSLGTLRVDGAVDFRGNVSLGNATTDTVIVAGPITAGNNLTVTGTTTLNGASQINGTLTTTGSVAFGGSAGVTVSTNLVVGSGGVTFNASSIELQGAATLNVTSTANTTISGNLSLLQGGNSKSITYSRPGAGTPVVANLNDFLVIPGTIIAFAQSGSTPSGYIWCDGSAVSRATYPALFAAIGTTWGTGDGSTTFTLPDLRGLFLRGTGTNNIVKRQDGAFATSGNTGTYSGDTFGSHNHTLTLNTADYAAGFKNNIGVLAPNQNQQNTGQKSTAGNINPEKEGGGAPIANNGTAETKPVNATVTYFIKF
jgi:microcystin-dependent protein